MCIYIYTHTYENLSPSPQGWLTRLLSRSAGGRQSFADGAVHLQTLDQPCKKHDLNRQVRCARLCNFCAFLGAVKAFRSSLMTLALRRSAGEV